MEHLLQSSLPSLGNDLEFQVEKLSGTDIYSTDGLAKGSFLKLILHFRNQTSALYFFPNGTYFSMSTLPQDIKSIVDGWLETVKSKKLNKRVI